MLNKYRLWCNFESNFFYVWDDTIPIKCPNDGAHIIDPSSITLIESVDISSMTLSPSKYIVPLYSQDHISSLNDIIISDNVSNNTLYCSSASNEIRVSTNFKAYHDNALIGVTLSTSNLQTGRWGLHDSSNGLYFQAICPSNIHCCSMKNGLSNVYGSHIIQTTQTQDYSILYTPNEVSYYIANSLVANTYIDPSNMPSFILPLSVELSSSASSDSSNISSITVSKRYMKIQAAFDPHIVKASWRSMSKDIRKPIPIKGSFTPLISIRRKNNTPAQVLVLDSIDMITTSDMIIEIIVGGTLTGPMSYTDIDESNSVIEYDISSTSISGGTRVWYGYGSSAIKDLALYFNDKQITICGQAVDDASGSVSMSLHWKESW